MDKSGYIFFFLAAMSIIAVIMTVYDKLAAKKGRQRISEKALMTQAFFGGAVADLYIYINIHFAILFLYDHFCCPSFVFYSHYTQKSKNCINFSSYRYYYYDWYFAV